MLKKILVAAALASLSLGSAVAATTAAKPSMKPMSPLGAKCSKEADAKHLHGAARKKFRSACKHGAMGKGGMMAKPKK